LLTVVLDPQVCHLTHFLPRGFLPKFSSRTGTRARRCKKSLLVASRFHPRLDGRLPELGSGTPAERRLVRVCESVLRQLRFLLANALHHVFNYGLYLIGRESK